MLKAGDDLIEYGLQEMTRETVRAEQQPVEVKDTAKTDGVLLEVANVGEV